MTVITGVSGSGKSSLVKQSSTAIAKRFGAYDEKTGKHDRQRRYALTPSG
jgi:excinuclease UvrABC ATPase subunit